MPQAPHPYAKIGIFVLSMGGLLVSARGDRLGTGCMGASCSLR